MFARNPLNQSVIRQFTPECVYRNQQLLPVVEKFSPELQEYRMITKATFITINTCYESCLHVHIIKFMSRVNRTRCATYTKPVGSS